MKKSTGFTLIKLLVVVLIIGILAAVALPQYQKAVEKARMAQLYTWLSAIDHAQYIYFMANGAYTFDFSQLDITLPFKEEHNTATFDDWIIIGINGVPQKDYLFGKTMQTVPMDYK